MITEATIEDERTTKRAELRSRLPEAERLSHRAQPLDREIERLERDVLDDPTLRPTLRELYAERADLLQKIRDGWTRQDIEARIADLAPQTLRDRNFALGVVHRQMLEASKAAKVKIVGLRDLAKNAERFTSSANFPAQVTRAEVVAKLWDSACERIAAEIAELREQMLNAD